MTREEWYRHTILDAIIKVQEYVDLIFDQSVETDLSKHDALDIMSALSLLSRDLDKQNEKGGED